MGFTDSYVALHSNGKGHVDRGAERHRRHWVKHVHVSLQCEDGIQLTFTGCFISLGLFLKRLDYGKYHRILSIRDLEYRHICKALYHEIQ